MSVKHNPNKKEFTTTHSGHKAELAYVGPTEGIVDFTHTFVDEAIRGQGVAEELARAGLAFARENHLKVKTTCKFMAGFVQRNHAEYAELLT